MSFRVTVIERLIATFIAMGLGLLAGLVLGVCGSFYLITINNSLGDNSLIFVSSSSLGGAVSGYILVNGKITRAWLRYILLTSITGLSLGVSFGLISSSLLNGRYIDNLIIVFTVLFQSLFAWIYLDYLKSELAEVKKESTVEED